MSAVEGRLLIALGVSADVRVAIAEYLWDGRKFWDVRKWVIAHGGPCRTDIGVIVEVRDLTDVDHAWDIACSIANHELGFEGNWRVRIDDLLDMREKDPRWLGPDPSKQ